MLNKIKSFFVNVGSWLVWSSADPANVSLTIRGLLIGVLPAFLAVASFLHAPANAEGFTAFADGVRQLVEIVLGIVASGVTAFGIARKLYLTGILPVYNWLKNRNNTQG